ncbi:hypothetical protein HDV02_003268 [Globomyces sp. JEL0801]|nr:hypothetical protein HDV02_003268 [Globomyces sp. JEL0801]
MNTTTGKGLIAFAGLVTIQVAVGLVYKMAANGDKGYEFSRASALAMSEMFKLLLSVGFFIQSLDTPTAKPYSTDYFKSVLLEFYGQVPTKIATGMVGLSLILVDPGTINLVKSGSTFFTAVVLWLVFKRETTKLQWIAIIIQLLALITSQYDECKASGSYSVMLYMVICLATIISSLCGSFNDHLSKASSASLHALNIYLYASGFVFNLAYFIVLQIFSSTEPGFFDGFSGWGLAVVICNSLIGLAITAVYKYADAVIKCLAQSTSTSLLLIFSLILFGTNIRLVSAAGCLIIFLTTYLYMTGGSKSTTTYSPVKEPNENGKNGRTPDVESQIVETKSNSVKTWVGFGFVLGLFLLVTSSFFLSTEKTTLYNLDSDNGHRFNGNERVAVMVVGTTRTFSAKSVHQSIRRYIQSLTKKPDYFFQISKSNEGICSDMHKKYPHFSDDKALLHFNSSTKHVSWEEPSCDEPFIKESSCCKRNDNPGHWFSYMRKVSAYNHVKEYEKKHGFEYDWYIFIRPDLYFFEHSIVTLSSLNTNRIYISSKEGGQPLGDYIYFVPKRYIESFATSLAKHNDYMCDQNQPPAWPPEFQLDPYVHNTLKIPHQMLPIFFTITRCNENADCDRLQNEMFYHFHLQSGEQLLDAYHVCMNAKEKGFLTMED